MLVVVGGRYLAAARVSKLVSWVLVVVGGRYLAAARFSKLVS